MRSASLVALLTLVVANSAVAAENDAPVCNYSGNQQEMNACALRNYQAADRALNDTYKRVMAGLSDAKKRELRNLQRAWLKQRDPQCKAQVREYEGGSIWPLEFHACLQAATEQRTRVLETWSKP
ncbi:lysozyme inhibitor LprI family protein [Uliginosibacterium sp. H3]|uniref:Lysozyme inhibitor LprI family protein n=1 Tax=Uliginosibacterium silvisoli TaxID=3114758 RepID=A0ABU6JZR9_9RHOO|nr:lysozyme inhibitor LprI family protein [Uliginosibacterium sp. H3]